MFLYLAPYIGVGSDEDPFRPRGSEQDGWSAIDLRANGAVVAGRALLSVPVRDDTIGPYLGDAPDEVSAAIKSAIESRLGITLDAPRLRHIIPELLIAHAREDGTRWRPLRAMRDGLFRVYLGGLWWQARSLSGGTTITESFNTADSGTLGPDLTWAGGTEWAVVSNQAKLVGSVGADRREYAASDLASDDHYVQATLIENTPDPISSSKVGVLARKDSTATVTFYEWYSHVLPGLDNFYRLAKQIGGTQTSLGTAADDFATGVVAKLSCDGSTIVGLLNGVPKNSVTDTSISGNLRCGIMGFAGASAASIVRLDSFEAGDLVTDVFASDSLRVGLSEYGDLRPELYITEATRIGLAETFNNSAELEPSDSLRAGLQDAVDLLVSLDISDTLPVHLSETGDTVVVLDISDTARIGLGDVADLLVQLDPSDSLRMGMQEAAYFDNQADVTETLRAGLSEAAAILVLLDVSDLLPIGLAETAEIVVLISATEAVRLGLQDAGYPYVSLDVTDALRVAVSEEHDESVEAWLTDALRAGLADALDLLVSIDATETARVAILDVGEAIVAGAGFGDVIEALVEILARRSAVSLVSARSVEFLGTRLTEKL